MTAPRRWHLVVWGATGFTGRLVARYLAETYGTAGTVQWAIAGRNPEKLAALKDELTAIDPAAKDLAVLRADSHDPASLLTLAQQAAVMLTTVGPYATRGAELVAACVAAGTDYVDLTGETPFIRRMIDAHHAAAVAASVRLVHCCGFDSIPSDMGVLFLQRAAQRAFGHPVRDVTMYLEKLRGGFSGGTAASMLHILETATDPAVRRALTHPYSLNPDDGVRGPDGPDQRNVVFDTTAGAWTAPFVMAGINTRVVRRSHALMGYPYGTDFSYREVMSLPRGALGWCKAAGITFGLGAFVGLAMMRPTRALLQKTVLPAPGEGPSPQTQQNGSFRIRLVGTTANDRIEVVVRGKRDPGYGATSRMLTEAALCLAFERDALPQRFGSLTPAAGLGEVLFDRLKRADVVFEVVGDEVSS